jgi:predicted cobalt transporter CbtA
MLQRILTCALLAGLATGVLLWGLHATLTVPLIAHAEVYEEQAHAKSAQSHAHEHAAATVAEAHAESWTPKGWQRMALTLLTTIVSTVGFALMLVSGAVSMFGTEWHSGWRVSLPQAWRQVLVSPRSFLASPPPTFSCGRFGGLARPGQRPQGLLRSF